MKKGTKLVAATLTAAAILFGTTVKAQTTPENKFRFGIGLELGAPTGNAHDISNFELGGTGRLQYGLSNNLAPYAYFRVLQYVRKRDYYNYSRAGSTTFKSPSLGIVPLKAGMKAFFSDNLYFGAEVGAGFETIHDGNTKLIVAPALGFANKTWDVSARYENFSGQSNSYGLVGLRVAYGFEL